MLCACEGASCHNLGVRELLRSIEFPTEITNYNCSLNSSL